MQLRGLSTNQPGVGAASPPPRMELVLLLVRPSRCRRSPSCRSPTKRFFVGLTVQQLRTSTQVMSGVTVRGRAAKGRSDWSPRRPQQTRSREVGRQMRRALIETPQRPLSRRAVSVRRTRHHFQGRRWQTSLVCTRPVLESWSPAVPTRQRAHSGRTRPNDLFTPPTTTRQPERTDRIYSSLTSNPEGDSA